MQQYALPIAELFIEDLVSSSDDNEDLADLIIIDMHKVERWKNRFSLLIMYFYIDVGVLFAFFKFTIMSSNTTW